MLREIDRQAAQRELAKIFKEALPAVGLPQRPAQMELSRLMLAAMLDNNIALCEAGTGISKTYAYLTAAFVFNKYRKLAGLPVKPVCISTCSIALQEAIVKEYLPTLNRALLRAGFITKLAMAVVLKGKQHYICDARLRRRLQCVNKEKKIRRTWPPLKLCKSSWIWTALPNSAILISAIYAYLEPATAKERIAGIWTFWTAVVLKNI